VTTHDIDRDTRLDVADVLVRYATAVDTRDWALFRTCFTADCTADYGEVGSWRDADELATFMQEIHDQCGRSLHRITNCVVTGHPGGAAARSYVDAVVMFPDNQNGTRAIGYYDDQLIRTPDGWRITQRRYSMIHLAMLEATLGGISL
jgi:3-phenylpropionate/cinnamic acid dioxygenase small subunit